jgi:hypothetical protein
MSNNTDLLRTLYSGRAKSLANHAENGDDLTDIVEGGVAHLNRDWTAVFNYLLDTWTAVA